MHQEIQIKFKTISSAHLFADHHRSNKQIPKETASSLNKATAEEFHAQTNFHFLEGGVTLG